MAETTREIPKAEWGPYFDALGRVDPAPTVTVEVDGAEIGAQVEAEQVTLAAISYDDRDDVLVIGLSQVGHEQVEHIVYNPLQIYALEDEAQVNTIDVQDADGGKTLILFGPSA
jgi:Family of unknown function (DUF5335)